MNCRGTEAGGELWPPGGRVQKTQTVRSFFPFSKRCCREAHVSRLGCAHALYHSHADAPRERVQTQTVRA